MAKGNGTKASKFVNPHREGSSYFQICETLKGLGSNRLHDGEKVIKAFAETLGTAKLKEYKGKEKRNENGLDWHGRLLQSVRVLARADYGAKLRAIGWEVRTEKNTFGLFSGTTVKSKPIAKRTTKVKATKAVKKATKVKASKAKPSKASKKLTKAVKASATKNAA
jgi:hypothetical protein